MNSARRAACAAYQIRYSDLAGSSLAVAITQAQDSGTSHVWNRLAFAGRRRYQGDGWTGFDRQAGTPAVAPALRERTGAYQVTVGPGSSLYGAQRRILVPSTPNWIHFPPPSSLIASCTHRGIELPYGRRPPCVDAISQSATHLHRAIYPSAPGLFAGTASASARNRSAAFTGSPPARRSAFRASLPSFCVPVRGIVYKLDRKSPISSSTTARNAKG